jgi:hypothetical protein
MWNLQWKSGTEADFCMNGFPGPIIVPPVFHTHLSSRDDTVEPVAVSVPSTWSHPTTRMN